MPRQPPTAPSKPHRYPGTGPATVPRQPPTLPSKPHRYPGTFAKPPNGRSSGKHTNRAHVPPRVHARGRNVGNETDQPVENDDAYQEAVEEQNGEDDGKKNKRDGHQSRNGTLVKEPEEISSLPDPPFIGDPKKRRSTGHPQKSIAKMWNAFKPQYLGKVTRILPDTSSESANSSDLHRSQNWAESYRQARSACEERVRKIIEECNALNQKYSDVHFDIERDLKITQKRDCLDGLIQDADDKDRPSDVKRVTDLFNNPKFFKDGAGFDDIIQGAIGDCWMMSAFSVLSSREELIRKICVIQDQDVGVYGFVFFRDGEWHPTIIDDKLYLRSLAFDESIETILSPWGREQEQKYTELFQRGSKALYFASCRDDNETWVPLLEKAFAKAHGGYDALKGGQTGECIEDLTGGVTTELYTTNILSKEKFWNNELRKIGKGFMFDATDALYREWQFWDDDRPGVKEIRDQHRSGVQARHAYAVLDAYEGYGERLVKVRNPWGQTEWDGPWSDGSPQWTAQWLERLDHKFGDDGVFWMSYKDFLSHYKHVNRTRTFDESWFTAQKWATVQVPFNTIDYQRTKFQIDIPEDTDSVIVLSQLDHRYFAGLEGKYNYQLQFRISRAESEDEYIARSRSNYELQRSTNLELYLKKGLYTVLIKVEATDCGLWGRKTPEEVIKANLPHRKEKVTTIGRLYDLAHHKGVRDDDESEDEESERRPSSPVMPPASASDVTSAQMATPLAVRASARSHSSATSESESESESDQDYSDSRTSSDSGSDSEEEKPKIEPWNASCVVGLRVYSKESKVSVKVIWPSKKSGKKIEAPPQLDRDAITKAPQDEAKQHSSPIDEKKPEFSEGEEKDTGEPHRETPQSISSK